MSLSRRIKSSTWAGLGEESHVFFDCDLTISSSVVVRYALIYRCALTPPLVCNGVRGIGRANGEGVMSKGSLCT